ncbi:hypothetical protein [Micromonospora sp. NPDC049662]|uniref:hypothetical protein n=1 Tax=Micromonospora sp. NPDC049662 TaxID=3155397 RepID=UPI003435CCA9
MSTRDRSDSTGRLAVFAALAATFDLAHDVLDQWGQSHWQARNKDLRGRRRVYRDGGSVDEDPGRARAGERTLTAGTLGRCAAAAHVGVYSVGQTAAAVLVTRALGYRVPTPALAAGAALNAVTHVVLDRRQPLFVLARAAGKGDYLDTVTVMRTGDGPPAETGPGTATFELDRSAHRAIGLLAALTTAWLATRASKHRRRR